MTPSWRGQYGGAALTIAATLMLALPAFRTAAAQQRAVTVADLVGFTDVVDLQMSPDGLELAYVTQRGEPAPDLRVHELWHMSTRVGGIKRPITRAREVHEPRWVRGGGLSFLATDGNATQLYLLDSAGSKPRRITNHPTGVASYAWSQDARHIAFLAKGHVLGYETPSVATRGVVVSRTDFIVSGLGTKDLFAHMPRAIELWLVDPSTGKSRKISGKRSVRDFAWSPSGRELAFSAYAEGGLGVSVGQRTDLLSYALEDDSVSTLLMGTQGRGYDGTIAYRQPIWSPDGRRIAVLREDQTDRWAAIPQLGVLTLRSGALHMMRLDERSEFYDPQMLWITNNRIMVENFSRGRRGLFSIAVSNGQLTPLLPHSDENRSEFAFSANGRRVAWVQQSLTRPPEIYVADSPFGKPQRLTKLNASFDSVWLPEVEAIRYPSNDRIAVEGWLLKPRDYVPGRRYPLVVMVHGGPIAVNVNQFKAYPPWPYPIQVFAARGYAVFLPNYRGTGSFGKQFRQPTALDAEPVDDILLGIEHLVARGIADPELIGIMGHSHGGWLGPVATIRFRNFRAASFAEGPVDWIALYGYAPGWLNLGVHEYYAPGTPYEQLQRYVDLSPIFKIGEVETPTLLEYGQWCLASQGLEYAGALWRHGVPHELVIYPRTDHNITSPALALDAMARNLDWFDFWMLGRKDPSPTKAEQYRSWEQMRASASTPAVR